MTLLKSNLLGTVTIVECLDHPGDNTVCTVRPFVSDDYGDYIDFAEFTCTEDNYYTVPETGHF